MNRYHVEVIGSPNPNKIIGAEFLDVYGSGCYAFKRKNMDGELEVVAYLPIYKTSIIEIEYDIEYDEYKNEVYI